MSELDFLFRPRSIAIVGSPRNSSDIAAGAGFLHALIKFGYGGEIYPVNPKASEIMGLKAYPDLMSVPQTPDFVISCIPARLTPQLIRDCAAKGVKAVSLYTAGFSEAGEDGARLERELVSLAREGGVRLVGPNCMGLYCPSTGLSYQAGQSSEPGHVGILCQSGGNSNVLAFMGRDRGIRFSKIISYGNAADLNEADFLEYLAEDVETNVIGVYIEGVRAGQRFPRALANAAKAKPVIVLKGGRAGAGTRAAASHTGSLATTEERWDALCQQAGAMQVSTLEEMLDLIEAASYMKPPKGRRVGILGWGGGASVTSTDACESAGLSVPGFSDRLKRELSSFAFGPGSSISNPVDSVVVTDPSLLSRTVEMVADSNEVDVLLVHLPLATPYTSVDGDIWGAAREALMETGKSLVMPLAVVQPHTAYPESSSVYYAFQQRCAQVGLALYPTTNQASLAISRLAQYHLWRSRQ